MAPESMSEVHERLEAAGFDEDLVATDEGLVATGSGRRYEPASLRIAATVRFEGASDPDEEALVVALAGPDGSPVGLLTVPFGPGASAAEANVLTALHQPLLEGTAPGPFSVSDHRAAVFNSGDAAEAAVAGLRRAGLDDTHLGVALHTGATMAFERDAEEDLARDVRRGAGLGAVIGVLGGVALFSLAVPGVGVLGVGGLAAAGVAGGIGGTMLGAYLGVGAATDEVERHEQIRRIQLQPGETMVVVRTHGHADTVEGILQSHGGRLVTAVD